MAIDALTQNVRVCSRAATRDTTIPCGRQQPQIFHERPMNCRRIHVPSMHSNEFGCACLQVVTMQWPAIVRALRVFLVVSMMGTNMQYGRVGMLLIGGEPGGGNVAAA